MEQDFGAYARFNKAVDRYRSAVAPKRVNNLQVHLFYGKPGTGKTRMAYELMPELYAFPIGANLWSDGYFGQPEVLIDDFNGQMRLVDLLRFLDRYPILIPRKGGFNWYCPDWIVLTTNVHPSRWYDYSGAKKENQEAALRRRIHHVWDFDDANYGELENQPHHITGDAIFDWWQIR